MKAGAADGTFDISTCAATTHVVPGGTGNRGFHVFDPIFGVLWVYPTGISKGIN